MFVIRYRLSCEFVGIGDSGNFCPVLSVLDALHFATSRPAERLAAILSHQWGRTYEVILASEAYRD